MRFLIMHKTNAHWESGAIPGPKLVARVRSFIGELSRAGVLLGAEGLRASSLGARLIFSGGERTIVRGPFEGGNELPAGLTILAASSLDEAIEWATRQAHVLGDGEFDIRPVTEPWHIGLGTKPIDTTTERYMILRKANGATESGNLPTSAQRTDLAKLVEATTRSGRTVASASVRPSRRGRRYKNSRDGVTIIDGPFVETKELLAGYVMVSADSLDDACRWALPYIDAVGAAEVDVLEVE